MMDEVKAKPWHSSRCRRLTRKALMVSAFLGSRLERDYILTEPVDVSVLSPIRLSKKVCIGSLD